MDNQFEIAQRIMDLYVAYWKDYVVMDKKGNIYRPRPQRDLTIGEIMEHLDGGNTISVLANKRSTIFLCFDVDTSERDRVLAVRDGLIELGIPDEYIYISTSGSKGYHVEVFFDREVWNTRAQNLYRLVFSVCGVDQTKIECRPLATMAIKLPLGINHKTGKRCWYINKETFELIEDFSYIFQIRRFSADKLDEIIHDGNKAVFYRSLESAGKPRHASASKLFKLPVITGEGQRHGMMCSIAMHCRVCGMDEDEIFDRLMDWVRNQDRGFISGTDKDIERDARSIAYSVMKKDVVVRQRGVSNELPPNLATYVTTGDAERIVAIKQKSYRMVAFLLFAYCRRWNVAAIGYDRISEITGVSRATAICAVDHLVSGNLVEKKETGGIRNRCGEKVRMANEYRMIDADDGDVKYEMSISDINERFAVTYYHALVALIGMKRLRQVLSRSEVKEIKNERID